MTGDGMPEFFEAVATARKEYETYVRDHLLSLSPNIHPVHTANTDQSTIDNEKNARAH